LTGLFSPASRHLCENRDFTAAAGPVGNAVAGGRQRLAFLFSIQIFAPGMDATSCRAKAQSELLGMHPRPREFLFCKQMIRANFPLWW
jgi:hypothetical protein